MLSFAYIDKTRCARQGCTEKSNSAEGVCQMAELRCSKKQDVVVAHFTFQGGNGSRVQVEEVQRTRLHKAAELRYGGRQSKVIYPTQQEGGGFCLRIV